MKATITRFTAPVLIVGLLAPAAALAASAYFVTGPNFLSDGATLNVTGSVAGLSDEDVTIVLQAHAIVTSVCTNPADKTSPAAVQPGPTGMEVTLDTGSLSVQGGEIDFDVSATFESPIPGAPGCPSAKFTQTIVSASFDEATLTFFQESVPVLSYLNEF